MEVDPKALLAAVIKRNPNVPQLKFVEDDIDAVCIEELKGGYGNYTYRVISKDGGQSVVLKHGKDHFKVFPDQAAPLRRRLIEYEMLKRLDANKSGSCPKPYLLDMVDNVIIMEDLSSLTLLGDLTQRGEVDIEAMKVFGKQLAELHRSTTEKNMTKEAWQELQTTFGPVDSCVKEFWFEKSVDTSDTSIALTDEMVAAHEMLTGTPALMAIFTRLRKHMDNEHCLIHPDNHQNSIFIGNDRCALFDLEVVGLSVREANVGTLPFWFVCALQVMPDSTKKQPIRCKFRAATKAYLEAYIANTEDLQDKDACCKFVTLTATYLCAMTFRVIATLGVDQFFPSTPSQKATLMKKMLEALMVIDDVKTVGQLLDAVF